MQGERRHLSFSALATKPMRTLHAAFLLLSSLPAALFAQNTGDGFSCLANHPDELQRHLDATPGALERAMQAKAQLDEHTQGFVRPAGARAQYVIPVVVHIIHDNGPENISDAQVYDAVRILNEDFNKENPDWPTVRPEFLDIVGDVGIEFRLARKDPQGNCSNGITRTVSTQTYVGDYDMTQLIQWPRDRYMNVWVCADANGAAGYTYYPIWLDDWPEADGMVMRHDYLGSIGTSSAGRSRVWGHEVGHWLNLKHCWGDSNEPGDDSNCFMDDDVADTPLTVGWTSCFLNGSTCGSPLDNVQNYMEYSYCAKMFTAGQADRMIAALTSPIAQRNNLWQAGNLALTGVEGPGELCVARMAHGPTEVCAGGSVAFRDESYNSVVTRTWSFPGGEPATSSEEQPVVTYSTPGSYPVTLTVSDGTTTLSDERVGLVTVLPDPGTAPPFSEGFEAGDLVGNERWVVRNPDGDATFEVTDEAAYSGSYSLRLANGAGMEGLEDDLVSTTFDMSSAETITITYRYAFARRTANNDDKLRVLVSRDCGDTWSIRQQLRASTTLSTAPNTTGIFIPASADQWGFAEVANISSAFHSADFRIRFAFESDGGNRLYLDDINLNGLPVGIAEMGGGMADGLVVPNPVAGAAELLFDLDRGGLVRLDVLDPAGRVVATRDEQRPAGTSQRMALPVEGLAAGTYLVRARTPDGPIVRRFTVDGGVR